MSRFSELKNSFGAFTDRIRDSEAVQQIKAKYDELDPQSKLYLNLGGVIAGFLFILITVISGLSTVNGLKNDMNEREEMIGWLQRSGDNLKLMKAQFESKQNDNINTPLNSFIENVGATTGLNPEKLSVAAESAGETLKEAKEVLVDVKMAHTNLKVVTRFLFNLTDQGEKRNLTIKNLTIDTKEDPDGYIDVSMTVAGYKPK